MKKENSEADEKAKVAKQLAEVKSGKTADQQKSFVEIVTTHADKYKNAKNDIKKSISRKKRVTALKALFGGKNTEVGSYVDKTPMEIFKWENDCFDSKCMNHHNPTACKTSVL